MTTPETFIRFCCRDLVYEYLDQITIRPSYFNLSGLTHRHNEYEIFINLGDAVHFMVGDFMVDLPPGGVALLPPDVEHYVYNAPGEKYHRARLHIAREALERFSFYEPDLISYFPYPCGTAVMDDGIRNELRYLESLAPKKGETGSLAVILETLNLLLKIHMKMEKNTEVINGRKRVPPILREILMYIHQNNNYLQISTNHEIAKKFFITESYLSRLFQKYMPVSAHQYLVGLKISHAKMLLSQGMSVTEVCYIVGFCDCSHFISVYKNIMGETPKKTADSARDIG